MNSFILSAVLLTPGAEPPATAPKPVAATREEMKALLEAHKTARPRLPFTSTVHTGVRATCSRRRWPRWNRTAT